MSILKRIIDLFRSNPKADDLSPTIIPRAQHPVSRKDLSANALKVLNRLKKSGYEAYLVGGCIRDLLLGATPKDFDIATNATPEQIKAIFSNCRLIGRRFRLAHVFFGRDIIEVATFRGENDNSKVSQQGMLLRDNVFGSLAEDVFRRDFTINALYYNIKDFSIIDYVGAIEDIENKTLRIIGDASTRYREDPVRMLRAVRLAAKLDLEIEEHTAQAILQSQSLLAEVSSSRLFEESQKLFLGGHGQTTYYSLEKFGLLGQLFPITQAYLKQTEERYCEKLIQLTLMSTDNRIREGKPVTPAFLLAAMLWHPLQDLAKENRQKGLATVPAFDQAISEILSRQGNYLSIPKRFQKTMREMWSLQFRLTKRQGNRAFRTLSHPRFRAAYDLLVLRGESGEKVDKLGRWWTEFQFAEQKQQWDMLKKISKKKHKSKKTKAVNIETQDPGNLPL